VDDAAHRQRQEDRADDRFDLIDRQRRAAGDYAGSPLADLPPPTDETRPTERLRIHASVLTGAAF
jgi:hypothetical protein